MERYIFIFIFLFMISGSYGQHDFDSLHSNNDQFKAFIADYSQSYDLFGEDDLIDVTLRSDFKNLIKNKYKDEYQDAILEFNLNDTVIVRRKVKIKPRGEFRLRKCSNPPLMVNFKKKDVLLPQLKDFDKIKNQKNNKYFVHNKN